MLWSRIRARHAVCMLYDIYRIGMRLTNYLAPMRVQVCICAYAFVLGRHACCVRVRLWTYTCISP
jgi:hypothetical protein